MTKINHERENRNDRLRKQTARKLYDELSSQTKNDVGEDSWLSNLGFILLFVLEYSTLFAEDPGLDHEGLEKEFWHDYFSDGNLDLYRARLQFAWAGWAHNVLSGKALAAECFFACGFLSNGGMNLNVFKRYVEEDGVSAIQKYGRY